jgi:hypothetical protein
MDHMDHPSRPLCVKSEAQCFFRCASRCFHAAFDGTTCPYDDEVDYSRAIETLTSRVHDDLYPNQENYNVEQP